MESGACICLTCCAVPKVSITLSTMHSTSGENPRMVNDMVYVFCQDPDSSAAFLRSVMDEREDMIHGLNNHQKHVSEVKQRARSQRNKGRKREGKREMALYMHDFHHVGCLIDACGHASTLDGAPLLHPLSGQFFWFFFWFVLETGFAVRFRLQVIVDGGGGGGGGGGGIPAQIKALDELRDQGILTDAEFDSKKKDLLAKM